MLQLEQHRPRAGLRCSCCPTFSAFPREAISSHSRVSSTPRIRQMTHLATPPSLHPLSSRHITLLFDEDRPSFAWGVRRLTICRQSLTLLETATCSWSFAVIGPFPSDQDPAQPMKRRVCGWKPSISNSERSTWATCVACFHQGAAA